VTPGEVFVDTVAWLAWLNRRDRLHDQARSAMLRFEAEAVPLVTTSAVIIEVANSLSQPPLRPLAVAIYQRVLLSPRITLVDVDGALFARGWELFESRPDKAWSLTDCMSFVVMQDRAITEALTADQHFEQAGFRAVLRRGG